MARELREDEVGCLDCGAVNSATTGRCWLCGNHIDAGTEKDQQLEPESTKGDDAARSPPTDVPASGGRLTFHLDSLLLTMTLVAVCAGVTRLSPGLGIAFAVISAPAFLRTAVAARRKRREGSRWSPIDKAVAFVGSLLVVVTVAISAGVAFYLTCWVGFCGTLALSDVAPGKDMLQDASLGAGVLLGVIVGILVGGFLLWRLWPLGRSRSK